LRISHTQKIHSIENRNATTASEHFETCEQQRIKQQMKS